MGTELLARHLTHSSRHPVIHYWNNGQKEVDYVLRDGATLQAHATGFVAAELRALT